MKSALYRGVVVHQRLRPMRHRLRYRLFWMLFDLDELPVLGQDRESPSWSGLTRPTQANGAPLAPSVAGGGRVRPDHDGVGRSGLRFFSHNGRNLLGFRDRDHLDGSDTPLRIQIENAMRAAGIVPDGGAFRVLCMPRVLGSVFNPISVWFCHRRDETLAAMLYEVNNTFGQRHSYLIPVADPDGGPIRQSCDKAFYVSPFMRMAMTYDFRVVPPGDTASVIVDGSDAEGKMIVTSFTGRREALTDAALLRVVLRHGVLALTVLAAIHWEAVKLWLKGLRIQPRPAAPDHAVTIVQPHES